MFVPWLTKADRDVDIDVVRKLNWLWVWFRNSLRLCQIFEPINIMSVYVPWNVQMISKLQSIPVYVHQIVSQYKAYHKGVYDQIVLINIKCFLWILCCLKVHICLCFIFTVGLRIFMYNSVHFKSCVYGTLLIFPFNVCLQFLASSCFRLWLAYQG